MSRRISDLDERIAKLEREHRELLLDWENTYDKLRTMMGRIAKRAEKMHDEAESAGQLHPIDEETTSVGSTGPGASNGRMLTPHQQQVQQKVLRRRAGL